MKSKISGMLAVTLLAGAVTANAALTVQTTNFLSGYTNYNGFEGMGQPGIDGTFTGPYTEDGITVEYVGNTSGILSNSGAAEGSYSWYPNGGGTGYTRITFGGTINAVEFQAGSGWFSAADALQYDALLAGVSVGTGQIPGLSNGPGGFKFYGFSGTNFDEVRLQAQSSGATGFAANAFEAGRYDAINFGGTPVAGVPEPATLALLSLGLAGLGFSRRRTPN